MIPALHDQLVNDIIETRTYARLNMADIETLASMVEKKITERDAEWQEILRQTGRLHLDSLVLAKSIARTEALEEAAQALDIRASGGTAFYAAARIVRGLKGI